MCPSAQDDTEAGPASDEALSEASCVRRRRLLLGLVRAEGRDRDVVLPSGDPETSGVAC